MNFIKGLSDSLIGTLSDQWKEIITAGHFDEQLVIGPGVLKGSNNGRGVNKNSSNGVISNGSIIRIPENTAAIIFNQSGIESVLLKPGEFIYRDGEATIFDNNGFMKSIVHESINRFGYGGQAITEKRIAFVNLREIRGLQFETLAPVMYQDNFYGLDLEIRARGKFSIQVIDVEKFIKNYLPANTLMYSFARAEIMSQLNAEFIESLTRVIATLSIDYRLSQLVSQTLAIKQLILDDTYNAGSWENRFGFKLVSIAIESIEMTEQSKKLIEQYNKQKIGVSAYEEVSQKAANIATQQKVATGVQEHGFGEGAGMILGLNLAQEFSQVNPFQQVKNQLTFEEQVEAVKKLKELLDQDILTMDEFNVKKKEIMNL